MNSMRPSRHEEDLMLEKQAKFVKERFDATKDGMADLCSALSKFTRTTAKLRDANDQLASAMDEYASKEQMNASLKQTLYKMSQSLATLSDYRDDSTQYLEEQVMTSVLQYAARCKNCDSEIRNVHSAKEKQISKRRQLSKIRQRLPQNVKNVMKAESDLVEASSNVAQLQESLEQFALAFEMSKIADLKRILHDFIKAELIFHARAVETLTEAFSDVCGIDVEADYQTFKDVLIRPNIAVRLDIVRNVRPPGHRVGIPRNLDDSALSTTTDDVQTTIKQNTITEASERTSTAAGVSAVSESADDATSGEDDADDSVDYPSEVDDADDCSSTIYVKPSTTTCSSRPF